MDVPAGKPQSGDRTASTEEQLLFPRHEVNTTLFFFKFFFLFFCKERKVAFFKKYMALECKTIHLHPETPLTVLGATPVSRQM